MSLTQDIKDHALDLGYSRVGVTTAAAFDGHIDELRARADMYAFHIDSARRPLSASDPRTAYPGARSIVSVTYDYARGSFPPSLTEHIGRLYLARCYEPPPTRIHGARHQLMEDYLRQRGCQVFGSIKKGYPERLAAARAGIATFGDNTFAYAGASGSFVVLSSFVVDVELEVDEPTVESRCSPACRRCIDACPTGALYAPRKLDPRRCIAYNNWITAGRPGIDTHIPIDVRERMGVKVHGCDACQEACPRNARALGRGGGPDPFLERIARDFSLTRLLDLTEEFYARCVGPILYNYIQHRTWFRRNAAIALGNLGDREHVGDLGRALADPEDVVRAHAAWALGRLGGRRARDLLEAALGREACAGVVAEIRGAMERMA
jgi:epoxyqueuosine reductase